MHAGGRPPRRRRRPGRLRHLDREQSLVFCLGTGLSSLESDALRLYLEGNSYEEMAEGLGCDTKTIDNALQRVKRKVLQHQSSRAVLDD